MENKDIQYILENILRKKIYNSKYWKENCYALNEKSLIDKAIELKYIGGQYSSIGKPTNFISLVLKLLQINPSISILKEYLYNESHKYLTVLAAFYTRISQKPFNVYILLEPLLSDYRKIRVKESNGSIVVSTVDQVIYELLYADTCLGVSLPKIPSRYILEENNIIDEYHSILNSLVNKETLEEELIKTNINIESLIVKNGYNLNYQESDDDSTTNDIEFKEVKQKEEQSIQIDDSIEYWNNIRVKLGLPSII